MHTFPKVYALVKEDTAKMQIFPLHEKIDVGQLKKEFPRFMIKGYVKSVKGTEFPAFFDHTIRRMSSEYFT